MGTKIDDIVVVNITRENARMTQQGFGTPLILGETSRIEDRVLVFTDPDEMLDAGFELADNLYLAAVSLMSQELSPEVFKIGRKLADVNAKQLVSFTGTPSAGTWTLTLGEETTAAIAYNAVAAAVESALELLTGIEAVTVTGDYADGFTIEFTGADAATAFETLAVGVGSLTGVTAGAVTVLQYGSAAETWAEALAAVRAEDDDWYCLIADTRTEADILALAAAIEPLVKIYTPCTADVDVPTSADDDLMSTLQDNSYDRTAVIYSGDADSYPDAAWPGGQLPNDPGSITWKFKTLVGVTPDNLTTTQVTHLKAKNANFYETVAGRNLITSNAVVASGEYIDIIRGIDWLTAQITEAVFLRLANSKKVPYTDQGIAVIENEILSALIKAENPNIGLLVKGSSVVTVPKAADVSSVDKAARALNDITFTAQLAGAIQKVSIAGRLTV